MNVYDIVCIYIYMYRIFVYRYNYIIIYTIYTYYIYISFIYVYTKKCATFLRPTHGAWKAQSSGSLRLQLPETVRTDEGPAAPQLETGSLTKEDGGRCRS